MNEEDVPLDQKPSYYITQPLGLCYLGGVLLNAGYEVEIYDPHIEIYENFQNSRQLKDLINEKIRTSDFDVLGVSAPYIYTYEWAHYIASKSKEKNKDIPVVIGNGYPSLLPDKALSDKNIDYIIIGEAEISFPKLLKCFDSAEEPDLEGIDGIGYKKSGRITIEPKRTFITEVDSLPLPAWHLVNVEKYMSYYKTRRLTMVSSRGCPYSCTFCNSYLSWGRKFRKRSAESVLREIEYLIDNFKIRDIFFVDDNMTLDKERFMKIAEGIKEKNISWDICNVSSFGTDEEMLAAIKDSGGHQISISVESAAPKILKAMRKPVDLEKTKILVDACKKLGLKCRLNYIIGLPYETKEDVYETLKYSEEVRCDWNMYSILVPYPGTDVYKYCVEKKYFIEDKMDLNKFYQRQVLIENEYWNKEWIKRIVSDYNIKLNFLNNYNLVSDIKHVDNVIEDLESIIRLIPEHIIAMICLAYAYYRKRDYKKTREFLIRADELYVKDNIKKSYGKYFECSNEEVIKFYKNWRQNELLRGLGK